MTDAGAASALAAHLQRLLRRQPTVVVFGLAEEGALPELDRAVRESGLASTAVLRVRLVGAEAWSALAELNRSRDAVLGSVTRLVLIEAADEGGLREARRIAPDLLSAVDLSFTLRAGRAALDLQAVRAVGRRNGALDIPGLFDVDVEDVYIELVQLLPEPWASGTPRRPILVYGRAGSGKTTWLRHLAASYAEGRDALGLGAAPAPLFAPLTAWVRMREDRGASLDLPGFLAAILEEQGVSATGGLEERLPDLVVLLDGLDAVPGEDERRGLLGEVLRCCRDYPGLTVVISGRPWVLDELHGRGTSVRLASLRVPSDQEFAVLARRQLVALELPGWVQGSTPAGSAPLDIVLQMKLGGIVEGAGRRSRIFRIITREVRDAERLWALAPSIAWHMLDSGRTEVSTLEVQISALRLAAKPWPPFLAPSGPRSWRFVPHETMGEYFAGATLTTTETRWDAVLADPFRPEWHEVVVFCVGELDHRADPRIVEIVRALIRKPRTPGPLAVGVPTLLAAVLDGDPQLPLSLRKRLVERYVGLVVDGTYWPASRPAVAQSLADTAAFATDRSWKDFLVGALRPRFVDTEPRLDLALAWHIGAILRDVGLDPTRAVEAVRTSTAPWRTVAWLHNRYVLGDDAERAAVLADLSPERADLVAGVYGAPGSLQDLLYES